MRMHQISWPPVAFSLTRKPQPSRRSKPAAHDAEVEAARAGYGPPPRHRPNGDGSPDDKVDILV